jgi:hypothetical protein
MSNYPAGTLNLVAIEDGIYNWITNVVQGVIDAGQIIWRNQGEPLPARPCVTMKWIDGPKPIGRSASRFLNAAGKQPTVGIQMEATASIQVFGNTQISKGKLALQLAIDINSSLMRQDILDGLKANGCAVQQVGDPRNLSALEESEYEDRAGLEVVFGMVQNVSEGTSTIETVNVSSNIGGQDRSESIVLP